MLNFSMPSEICISFTFSRNYVIHKTEWVARVWVGRDIVNVRK